jgi:polar amino acid transport system substrate-binding protein
MRASYVACVAVVVMAALLGLWAVMRPPAMPGLDQWRQGVEVRAGYAIEAPFAFMDSEGRVTGEAPEMLRLVMGRLGVERISWRHAEFAELLNELEAGRLDVVAAGVFNTPERRRRACFTRPTVAVVGGLLVRSGNPLGVHGLHQLVASKSARVAVIAGSVEAQRMREAGLPAARLLVFPRAQDALAAMQAERADVLSLSEPSLRQMLRQLGTQGFELATPYRAADPGDPAEPGWPALVFRSDLAQACKAADVTIAQVLSEPAHAARVERFGFRAQDLRAALTWDAGRP